MQSQRDGYNHLYLYNKEGRLLRQLTSGSWVVQQVLGFNAKQKSILIEANKYHPLHRWIYSVSASNGKMQALVSTDGVHHAQPSPSCRYLIDKWSSPTTPRAIDLIETNRKVQRLLTASDPWADYFQPIFECGTIKAADGTTDLYYRMVKPHDFDPAKKYPTSLFTSTAVLMHTMWKPRGIGQAALGKPIWRRKAISSSSSTIVAASIVVETSNRQHSVSWDK